MGVYKILEYRQKDGQDILKVIMSPTKQFPKGAYFYCDAEDIDLVERDSWHLNYGRGDTFYIKGSGSSSNYLGNSLSSFHQQAMFRHVDEDLQVIDHINHCGFDNCKCNLRNVSSWENAMNKRCCGYSEYYFYDSLIARYKKVRHVASIQDIKTEIDACKIVCEIDKKCFPYYDFFNDFSDAIDILDMERTGKISHEEAIYRRLARYNANIWYWFRYDFFSYYTERAINMSGKIPEYALDNVGRLVDPYLNVLLNPYYRQINRSTHGIDYLWYSMDDLLKEEGVGLIGCLELGETAFIDLNAKPQVAVLGNPKADAKIALIREFLSKQTKL